MYRHRKPTPTTLIVNDSVKGETLEQKIERIVNNKAPITDGAPIVFTERKDGVRPEFNPRTDKWDLAIDAMTAVAKTETAKRAERQKAREPKKEEGEEGAKPPIDSGTSTTD